MIERCPKIIITSIILASYVVLLASFICTTENFAFAQTYDNKDVLRVVSNSEGKQQVMEIPVSSLIFNVIPHYDENNKFKSITMSLKPELHNFYQEVGFFGKPHDIVVVYPIFTQAAYGNNGFYDYYNKKCDSQCLTVNIPAKIQGGYPSSLGGSFALKLLNYSFVTDIDIDKNPDILKQYKRVIMLHNEYVTQKEFDAVTNHPDVVYLYPNALYAKVETNYDDKTITLIKGHSFPESDVKNGFGWQSDNSVYEYDIECKDWNFYKSKNNTMLNCYPEYRMLYSKELLRSLQREDPAGLIDSISDWTRFPQQPDTINALLNNYNIKGDYIPSWVVNPSIWVLNGEISKSEFAEIISYLHTIKTI